MPEWTVDFYEEARGQSPIKEYLRALPTNERARIVRTILLLEGYGPLLKMPHAQHIAGKVWELRIDGRPNSYRVLYAGVPGHKFLLLHIFTKHGRKMPSDALATAQRRLIDYLERLTP